MVLDHLVLHNAHACLFHSHLRKRNTGFVRRGRGSLEDFVHLFLGIGGKKFLGFFHCGHLRFQRFRVIDHSRNVCLFLCHLESSFLLNH